MKYLIFTKHKNSNYKTLTNVCSDKNDISEITRVWNDIGYDVTPIPCDKFFKDCKTLKDKVYKVLKCLESIDEYDFKDNVLIVSVDWGDWKHDHLHISHMITDIFPNATKTRVVTTAEDGSDCYSADHYFKFN